MENKPIPKPLKYLLAVIIILGLLVVYQAIVNQKSVEKTQGNIDPKKWEQNMHPKELF